MLFHRLPSAAFRLTALLFLIGGTIATAALGQPTVSPLPPPVTRGLYRSRWFEFLNAHLEDDTRAARVALAEMKRAAQTVGVHRLSDFARTASYEGRRARAEERFERANRAYDAALLLDDANCDAQFSRINVLLRRHLFAEAAAAAPGALESVVSTGESRLALLSALLLWGAGGLAAATLGSILILVVRHQHLWTHEISELAGRLFGSRAALPLALIVLLLPLAFGLGPIWVVLYWGALVYGSCQRFERVVLAAALAAAGLIPAVTAVISRENILEQHPLYVAAVDLTEKREDARAEDGLKQASAVFPEDADVWFLLGIFAERSADPDRALVCYERAVRAAPDDYRSLLNRGNIHFQEGNFNQAIRDYEVAAEKAEAPEIYYNLALARAETYDFHGQAEALQKAREISSRNVSYWMDHPTLARVVAASYPLSRARRKIEEWNAQPGGRRMPGQVPASHVVEAFTSPLALAPWAALVLALAVALLRGGRGMAAECQQCGKPYCKSCTRYGDVPGYCSACAGRRKDSKRIDAEVQRAGEGLRFARRRNRLCRLLSLAFPGSHAYFSSRPGSGFLTLFLFFFFLGAAVTNDRLFGIPQLVPMSEWPGLKLGLLAAAAVLWMSSLFSSWRQSHGT